MMTDYQRGVEQASAVYQEVINEYVAENEKLRELCASLYEFSMSEYPDGTELNFADRMRELGVEVDE